MASVYVGRLSRRTRERELEDHFASYGPIDRINLKHGYAFLQFADERDAEDAVRDLDNSSLDGERIIVEFSHGRGRFGDNKRPRHAPEHSDFRVIVENLPRDMSWQDLKDHFRHKCGDVLFGDVWRDRNGDCKGCIEFKYEDDMEYALRKMDGSMFEGRKIYVSPERASPSRSYSRSPYSRSYSRSPPRRGRRRMRSRSRSYSPSPRRSRSRSRSERRERSASPPPPRPASPQEKEGGMDEKANQEKEGTIGDGMNQEGTVTEA